MTSPKHKTPISSPRKKNVFSQPWVRGDAVFLLQFMKENFWRAAGAPEKKGAAQIEDIEQQIGKEIAQGGRKQNTAMVTASPLFNWRFEAVGSSLTEPRPSKQKNEPKVWQMASAKKC